MYEIRFQIKSMFIYDSFHLFPSTHRNHLQRQPSSSSSPITFHSVRPFLSCVFFFLCLKWIRCPQGKFWWGAAASGGEAGNLKQLYWFINFILPQLHLGVLFPPRRCWWQNADQPACDLCDILLVRWNCSRFFFSDKSFVIHDMFVENWDS